MSFNTNNASCFAAELEEQWWILKLQSGILLEQYVITLK
jgi:hypothetical protein